MFHTTVLGVFESEALTAVLDVFAQPSFKFKLRGLVAGQLQQSADNRVQIAVRQQFNACNA